MHDWTLIEIVADWATGKVTLSFKNNESTIEHITALGFSDLHIPKLHDWGDSVSVNEVYGPSEDSDGRLTLVIEIQSGDKISIKAQSINMPAY